MITINQLNNTHNIFINKNYTQKNNITSTNSINSNNINNLNYNNRSLISFRGSGYYQTLKNNYFELPIDKRTGEPFKPDIYQKAAAENLYKGNDVIVTAPTGTGKTAIAHYIINKNLDEGKKTFYTTPLKALSNDKVREFQKIYGKENVGLITGDRKINKDAPIIIMTTEVYRNMVVQDKLTNKNPILDNLKTVVFDELHYLGDTDRGSVWEQSIMFTDPKTQILSLSGTMANPEKVADWMAYLKGHDYAEKITPTVGYRANNKDIHTVLVNVPSKNRHVPLDYQILEVETHKPRGGSGGSKAERARARKKARAIALSDSATPTKTSYIDVVDKLKDEKKLPAIIFIFSKKEGRAVKNHLVEYGPKLTTNDESKEIIAAVEDFKSQGKYIGESLDIGALSKGYALHNAGMLPEQKELVEDLFQRKLLKVVISTETLSAGINMPARTTVISGVRKPTDTPDGDDHKRYISPNEYHQMAGRAGRRGIDTKGYCYSLAANKSQGKKFNELINTPSNDIESHFNIDYSFVATAGDAYRESELLKPIFEKSFRAYDSGKKVRSNNAEKMYQEFINKENTLKQYGYLDRDNNLTDKGILLTKINGYEQIPIIDAIADKDFGGLDAVQLAGYAAGLANMESTLKSDFPKKEVDFEFEDLKLSDLVNNMEDKISDYNSKIYSKDEKEIEQNRNAIIHVYRWASYNNSNEDNEQNWRDLYRGDLKKTIRDEGTLFREIVVTTDLLKQMDEIAKTGEKISYNPQDKLYYNNLSKTINDSIKLIDKEPARSSAIKIEEDYNTEEQQD